MKTAFHLRKINKNVLLAFLLFSLLSLLSVKDLETGSLPKAQERQALRHEVSVALKLVQVYVTDKQGNPVLDLETSDFTLFDNDKSQPITEFEKHVIASPSEKIAPPAAISSPPPGVAETMNRKFFLFFDFAFNNFSGVNMAKKAALHFIDTQVNPTDEVGVLSYFTGKGLLLYEYLTTDHSKVREVIKQIGFKEILGRAGQFSEDIESIKHKSTRPDLVKQTEDEWKRMGGNEHYRFETQQFSSALKDFAKALRYIPGYKHIIFFSMGVPNYLMYQMSDQIAAQQGQMNISASDGLNVRVRYETMLKELETSNSPVLAVNVEGLNSRFRAQEFEESFPRLGAQERGDTPNSLRFLDRGGKGDASLREMAKLTGGKYFGETNNYEKIAEDIQNLTSSYYVLGYKIDEKWDGKFHEIKVNVRRPRCEVYYPKGYFNPKPFAKYSDLEKKLHLIDLALAERPYFEDPIHFPLRALAGPMKQRSNLTLIAEIPIEKVLEISKEKMEIFALVFDEKKNIVVQQRTEMAASSLSRDKIDFYSISYLPSGSYDCRLVMRNLETGKGAVASTSIVIPKRFNDGLKLYSPLVLIPGKKGTYLNGSSAEKGEGRDQPYSLVDFYPFDPEQYAPLVNEISQDTAKLLVLLPSSIIHFEKPKVSLSAHLVNLSSGERKILPLTILGQHQEEDVIIYSLELSTEKLMPGEYSLYLFAEDSDTHQPFSHVISQITVR
jgi:VWFA-related protein